MSVKKMILGSLLALTSNAMLAAEIESVYPPLTDGEKITLGEYDMPKSLLGSAPANRQQRLPNSKTLVYNVYTTLAGGTERDLNYFRGQDINHVIDFCNITNKILTVNIYWQADGSSQWVKRAKYTNIQPQKCYIPTYTKSYLSTGIFLFLGGAIAQGQGQNSINIDSSKFMVR